MRLEERMMPSNPVLVSPAAREEVRSPTARKIQEAKGPAPQDRRPGTAPEEAAPDKGQTKQQVEDDIGSTGGKSRRPISMIIGTIVFALTLAAGGYINWDYAWHFESTDDAFVASRQFAVAAKVSGYITAVPVTDNEHVVAGKVIARIDDRDYRVALEQAQAQIAAAEASIENVDAQIKVQQAQLNASEAQLEQTQATLVFTQQQAERYQQLVQRQAGTVQQAQQTTSALHEQEAAVKRARASVAVAERQIGAVSAQRANAAANLLHAQAQRDQA
jgi:membrane fusion protein, multidrug efflux system